MGFLTSSMSNLLFPMSVCSLFYFINFTYQEDGECNTGSRGLAMMTMLTSIMIGFCYFPSSVLFGSPNAEKVVAEILTSWDFPPTNSRDIDDAE